MTQTNNRSDASVTISLPDTYPGKFVIPMSIAQELAMYGAVARNKHSAEIGCALKVVPNEDRSLHEVVEYHFYKQSGTTAYWESVEGERLAHIQTLIAEGKEDDIQYWTGIFHTHPINMSASMSGTDVSQLKELSGGGHFGWSVIAPANANGIVEPDKWRVHWADERQFDGKPIIVNNLKPVIEAECAVTFEDVEALVAELIVKPKPRVWTNTASSVGYGADYRNLPFPEDWVLLKSVSDDKAADALDEMMLAMMVGGVWQIEEWSSQKGVMIGGYWFDSSDEMEIIASRRTDAARNLKVRHGDNADRLYEIEDALIGRMMDLKEETESKPKGKGKGKGRGKPGPGCVQQQMLTAGGPVV